MTISPMRAGTVSIWGSKVYISSWHIASACVFIEGMNGIFVINIIIF